MTQVPPFSAISTPGNNATDVLIPPADPVPNHEASKNGNVPPPVTPSPAKKATPPRLGNNRPSARARKLTDEDRDKIAMYYQHLAIPLSLFAPDVGKVLSRGADDCADAWMKLAEENDSVRRAILALMEGSAWAGILTAHLPIVVAALPQRIVDNNPILGPIQAMVIHDADKDQESPEQ
jgi:hypothetical protein